MRYDGQGKYIQHDITGVIMRDIALNISNVNSAYEGLTMICLNQTLSFIRLLCFIDGVFTVKCNAENLPKLENSCEAGRPFHRLLGPGAESLDARVLSRHLGVEIHQKKFHSKNFFFLSLSNFIFQYWTL
jgi:hypothetical protein